MPLCADLHVTQGGRSLRHTGVHPYGFGSSLGREREWRICGALVHYGSYHTMEGGIPFELAPLPIRKPRKREVYKEQVPVVASIGHANAIAINELLCTIFLVFFIKGDHKVTVSSVSVAIPHTAQAASFLVGAELRLIDGGPSHFCAIAVDPPAHEQDIEGIAIPLWFPGNLKALWHETESRFPISLEHHVFFFVELSH